ATARVRTRPARRTSPPAGGPRRTAGASLPAASQLAGGAGAPGTAAAGFGVMAGCTAAVEQAATVPPAAAAIAAATPVRRSRSVTLISRDSSLTRPNGTSNWLAVPQGTRPLCIGGAAAVVTGWRNAPGLARKRSGPGQGQGELGTVTRLTARLQPAPVRVGQLGRHGQAYPAAGHVRGAAPAPEPVEDPGQLVDGDTRPGVADLQDGFR